jgi:hypothetical protein
MIINLQPGFKSRSNIVFRVLAHVRSLFATGRFKGSATPIVINNFNRLDCLKQQVAWLEHAGIKNIYIIDNASTYPPLLAYYKQCPYIVFRLTENVGHTAFWDTHIHLWFKNRFYVLTDPDVVPVEECPATVLDHFYSLLQIHHGITKVGFGLKIDDLPDHYQRKREVIEWETKYWSQYVGDDVYKAPIDTTFALYRPNTRYQQWDTTLRTGGIYQARHLPWYEDSEKPSDEEIYFKKVTTQTSSWYKEGEYRG